MFNPDQWIYLLHFYSTKCDILFFILKQSNAILWKAKGCFQLCYLYYLLCCSFNNFSVSFFVTYIRNNVNVSKIMGEKFTLMYKSDFFKVKYVDFLEDNKLLGIKIY